MVASQRALEEFIARPLRKAEVKNDKKVVNKDAPTDSKATSEGAADNSAPAGTPMDIDPEIAVVSPPPDVDPGDIFMSELVCEHGQLDPSKCGEMKRLSAVSSIDSCLTCFSEPSYVSRTPT